MNQKISHIMTIANSIIGVGILAMPYCFKQCGIILSICILVASSTVSRLSCHLLLKSAIMSRRKTFENLAFHAFGSLGKFIVEVGMIGFLLGTCIAFFVVMGDLGPAIIAKLSGTHTTDTLRTSILMALALFCVLPLGLLRNVDSLTSVSTASVGFYFCLVVKLITEAGPHIFSGDWTSKVILWRPAGILQCLPIFSMALFCQTQIFEIYQAIPNASLDRMNELIRAAVNICTGVYIFVGFFGYIAFCNQPFTGNILMSFTPSIVTDAITIGFVLSLAFSFPLIIFPCRASLYSLLYKQPHSFHEGISNYIPEGKFKFLTFMIVFMSLLTGVLIPNIELVLGLVGSTIGIMICVVFPATCFICISVKNTNERLAAQGMLFIGILAMVLGTYANLYAMEEATVGSISQTVEVQEPEILKIVKEDTALRANAIDIPTLKTEEKDVDKPIDSINKLKPVNEVINKIVDNNPLPLKEARQEPPQPVEPEETLKKEPQQIEVLEKGPSVDALPNNLRNIEHQNRSGETKDLNSEKQDTGSINIADKEKKVIQDFVKDTQQKQEPPRDPVPDQLLQIKQGKLSEPKQEIKESKDNGKKDEVDIDAIKKEEKELMDQEREEEKKKLDILKTLEKQHEVQKQLLEQQKELLGQIKQQSLKEDKQQNEIDKVNQEKLKAVKQIESIAKKAIESLGVENVNIDVNNNNQNIQQDINKNKDVYTENKKQEEIGKGDTKEAQSKNDNSENVILLNINKSASQQRKDEVSKSNLEINNDKNPLLDESDVNKKKRNHLINVANIVPMPLVNSEIYKNGDNKGIISLFNKSKLESLELNPNLKVLKSEIKRIDPVEGNVLQKLKSNNVNNNENIYKKAEERKEIKQENLENEKSKLSKAENGEVQMIREKREVKDEELKDVSATVPDKICVKDRQTENPMDMSKADEGKENKRPSKEDKLPLKKETSVISNNENKMPSIEEEKENRPPVNANINKISTSKNGASQPKESKTIKRTDPTRQSLSIDINLPDLSNFKMAAKDLQKDINIIKLNKRK